MVGRKMEKRYWQGIVNEKKENNKKRKKGQSVKRKNIGEGE